MKIVWLVDYLNQAQTKGNIHNLTNFFELEKQLFMKIQKI